TGSLGLLKRLGPHGRRQEDAQRGFLLTCLPGLLRPGAMVPPSRPRRALLGPRSCPNRDSSLHATMNYHKWLEGKGFEPFDGATGCPQPVARAPWLPRTG